MASVLQTEVVARSTGSKENRRSADGRRARTVRTRAAILDSAVSQIEAGDLKPTAASIAAGAGLSVRSVFQHFADLDDLFLAVADRQTNRVAVLYASMVYVGDFSSRLEAFLGYRVELYEFIAPFRRLALHHERLSPVVASRMQLAREIHRYDVERAFAPETEILRARGESTIVAQIAGLSSFVTWDEWRRVEQLTVEETRRLLGRSLAGLLADALDAEG